MGKQIYDKPTKILLRDFVSSLEPDAEFSKQDAVKWFRKNYPVLRHTTVEAHVEGMSINAKARYSHKNIKPGSGHDLLYKIATGRYRQYNPSLDGEPIYAGDTFETDGLMLEKEESNAPQDEKQSNEFAYEKDLQNYLARNLSIIEDGLTLFEDEDISGIEYPAGGRFIDILAVSKNDELVVIELKVSKSYDRVVGQLLRYMGWVKKELADGRHVRGIIIGSGISDDLKLATSMVSDVSLFEYELSLSLHEIDR